MPESVQFNLRLRTKVKFAMKTVIAHIIFSMSETTIASAHLTSNLRRILLQFYSCQVWSR